MWYEIYRHTSPSGKSYIGITSEDSYTRFTKHLRKARFGSTTNFHKAIRKYGEDCWQSEILDAFYTEDKKEAYAKEQSWIDSEQPEYNMDCGFGWNITDRRGDKTQCMGKYQETHTGSVSKVKNSDLLPQPLNIFLWIEEQSTGGLSPEKIVLN